MKTVEQEELMALESEQEVQNWLCDFFRENGWEARREVRNDSGFRADLIVDGPCGPVGIELKYFKGGGSKLADAHEQIVGRYRNDIYGHFGEVKLWAFCPFFHTWARDTVDWKNARADHRKKFCREFCCRHGIGYVDLDNRRPDICFNYSDIRRKIAIEEEWRRRYFDQQAVENWIDSIVDELEYGHRASRTCQYGREPDFCSAEAVDSELIAGVRVHLCEYHIKDVWKNPDVNVCD